MHPEPDHRIIDYLLGELSPAERIAFEREMADSPELKAEVRGWEADMAKGFGEPGPAASDDLWHKIEAALPEAESSAARRRPLWLFPAAAAALMAFALIITFLLFSGPRGSDHRAIQFAESEALAPLQLLAERLKLEGVLRDGETLADINPDDLLERIRQADSAALARQAEGRLREGEWARSDESYREMQQQQALLASAYETLSDRYFALFENRPGMARFTVIELVDANTFLSNGPRMGLAELARQFLMNDSMVGGNEPLYGPGLEEGLPINFSSLAAATRWPDQSNAGVPDTEGIPAVGTGQSHGGPASGNQNYIPVGVDETPFAFTVWSDDDQKGFMDIHNLPPIPAGQSANLWVRAAGTEEYLLIGTVPNFEKGTGSLFYSIEEPDFSPGEVIITLESDPQAQQPGQKILLQGP